jgi:NAD(P)-dependent dehydrogenase (short-subunit alcohol dehydrogenase family)
MDKSVAVVTGGTRGIGLGIAERLVQRGFSLMITYVSDEKSAQEALQQLDRLKGQGQRILTLRGDVGDAKIVAEHHRTIRKELGPVSVLVNNAGIMPAKSFEEISVKDWDETIRVNLNSTFYWCREVVPAMKEMKFGRLVNISSLAARGGRRSRAALCCIQSGNVRIDALCSRGVWATRNYCQLHCAGLHRRCRNICGVAGRKESRAEGKGYRTPPGYCQRCRPCL